MDRGRNRGLTWTEATCWLGTTSSGMITTSVNEKESVGSGPVPTQLRADPKSSSGHNPPPNLSSTSLSSKSPLQQPLCHQISNPSTSHCADEETEAQRGGPGPGSDIMSWGRAGLKTQISPLVETLGERWIGGLPFSPRANLGSEEGLWELPEGNPGRVWRERLAAYRKSYFQAENRGRCHSCPRW